MLIGVYGNDICKQTSFNECSSHLNVIGDKIRYYFILKIQKNSITSYKA